MPREQDRDPRVKVRVLKPPALRRGELIDCAQRLFLSRGYERTTINDVIAATGLSKGAFYHHFRSKEDLLEAIAARFAEQSLVQVAALRADRSRDALANLNLMLALGREWKREHMGELHAMFTTLLKPENAMLYQRIVEAVFAVLIPALATIIDEGRQAGRFDAGDARVAAETLLRLGNGRRPIVVEALAIAETDPATAIAMIVTRLRAEEALVDRILGLPPGSVQLLGSIDQLTDMMLAWTSREQAREGLATG